MVRCGKLAAEGNMLVSTLPIRRPPLPGLGPRKERERRGKSTREEERECMKGYLGDICVTLPYRACHSPACHTPP